MFGSDAPEIIIETVRSVTVRDKKKDNKYNIYIYLLQASPINTKWFRYPTSVAFKQHINVGTMAASRELLRSVDDREPVAPVHLVLPPLAVPVQQVAWSSAS